MKATNYSYGQFIFLCPGCGFNHGVTVDPPDKPSPLWQWNRDLDKPTISPSIMVRGTIPLTDEQVDRIMAGEKVEPVPYACHSFIEAGKIRFLGDSTHKLAGQVVDIPEQRRLPDDRED